MRRSLAASASLHLLLAALAVAIGALGRELPPQDMPISVEIVSDAQLAQPSPLPPKAPVAAAAPKPSQQAATPAPRPPAPKAETKPEPAAEPPPTKVAAKAPEPTPKVEPPPPEPKKPEPAPEKPKPVVEAPKPAPEKPKAAEAKPVETPRPQPEKPAETAKAPPKPDKPKTPPAPVEADNDFDALLRSVEQTPKRVQAPETRGGKGSATEAGGTGQPGTAKVAQINPSMLAASISRQITPCWNIPVAAQGVGGLRAELNIVLGSDGSVQSVAPTDAARMGRDPVFRAFAESAVRAVRACSPLKLPPESYQLWRNIIFNFDPSRLTG